MTARRGPTPRLRREKGENPEQKIMIDPPDKVQNASDVKGD